MDYKNFKLMIEDVSSLRGRNTEHYSIVPVEEEEKKYRDYYRFSEYKAWKMIIERVNRLRKLITLDPAEDIEFKELEKFIVYYLNKCDFCTYELPTCNGIVLEYGKKHNDNIINCEIFEENKQ